MTQEKECETNRRDNAGPRHAGNLKFQIRSENSAKQQQRRKRSDPKCDLLEASWLDLDDVALESGFLSELSNRIDNAFREQRFARDLFGGFLRVESKDCAFWVDDAVADFYFLLFVHECLGEVGIMAVLDGRASNECRPIRNRFFLCRGRQIFARRKNRCSRANCAHWRHVNMLCCDNNERAS